MSAATPPWLAANSAGLFCTSALTPMSAAVEPVKNVLIPRAVSTPLVSLAKENSCPDAAVIVSRLSLPTAAGCR